MNNTMLDIIQTRANYLCESGIQMLSKYSRTHAINTPGSSVISISPYGDQYWDKLPTEGKQVQAQLLPKIDRFMELVIVLTKSLPGDTQRELQSTLIDIRSAIEQNRPTLWKTQAEAIDGFRKLISRVISTFTDYYKNSSDEVLAVPDTNAFLTSPDIERWRFELVDKFDIILTPTVLSELDKIKIHHKNQDVRDKANKIIRKIKEYRRRGSLHEGIIIVKDHIGLRAIATDPKMSESLSWLNANNKDDCLLATSIEIIQSNLGARVFIVTGDINMQNKAELAGIPFVEIPDDNLASGLEGL
jgi:rRNA-processing protein FCF1